MNFLQMKSLSRAKTVALIATVIAFLYVFLSPFNSPLYELIMFPCPDFRTPDVSKMLISLRPYGIDASEIEFKSLNGKVLRGLFLEKKGSKRVFLFSHTKGNNAYFQIEKARCMCAFNASVFLYDYQGFGKSEGRMSVNNSCDDALAAYDYLQKVRNYSAENIIAVGQSYGSGVSGQLCKRRKLAAVIMLSGFSSLSSAGKKSLLWLQAYPDAAFPKQDLDNVEVFSKPHPPLLIVHGDQDRVISVEEAKRLFAKAIEPKQLLILRGGHCSFGDGADFAVCVSDFLKKHGI